MRKSEVPFAVMRVLKYRLNNFTGEIHWGVGVQVRWVYHIGRVLKQQNRTTGRMLIIEAHRQTRR